MPASVELFQRYLNPVLVETGTYLGEGIRHALAAGFASVRSVELSANSSPTIAAASPAFRRSVFTRERPKRSSGT
jgi:hypothetical protein